MATYTYNTVQENDSWIVYIDRDNARCIRQEQNHKTGNYFSSQADAESWAQEHCAELEASLELSKVVAQRNKVLQNAAIISAIVQAQSAKELMPSQAELFDAQIAQLTAELSI